MDIAALQTFITVAQYQSFSRAAEQLCLSQSAISKRIQTLEAHFSCQLFDRIGKRIYLTEAGRTLLPHATRMVNTALDSQKALNNLSQTINGTLHIGTSHHIGLHRLPSALKTFTQHFPEVTLDITFMSSEEIYSHVHRGELEIGIITLPNQLDRQLRQITLWIDPLYCVVAPDHPLTQMTRHDNIEALNHYPAILPAPSTFTRDIIESALNQPLQQPIHTRMETNYLETIKMLVSIGLGWSILPASIVDNSITRIMTNRIALQRHLGIIINKKRTLTNATNALINHLTLTSSPS